MPHLDPNMLNHFEENLSIEHFSFTLPSGNAHANLVKDYNKWDNAFPRVNGENERNASWSAFLEIIF